MEASEGGSLMLLHEALDRLRGLGYELVQTRTAAGEVCTAALGAICDQLDSTSAAEDVYFHGEPTGDRIFIMSTATTRPLLVVTR
jgi:hypothetical protein